MGEAEAAVDISSLSSDLVEHQRQLLSFWSRHGPDKTHPGFNGTVARNGDAIPPTHKGLIQHARHLWVFSTAQQLAPEGVNCRNLADQAYAFMMDHLLDAPTQLFVFLVSEDGKTRVMDTCHLYANIFAIFSLAKYSRVFGIDEALQQALRTFKAVNDRFYDAQHGGYDESSSCPPLEVLPEASEGETQVAPKGFNVHMHFMEALTELYRATGGQNEEVKERLVEVMSLLIDKVYQQDGSYCRQQFSQTWEPIGTELINYGHDLQTCHLMLDAVNALLDQQHLDPDEAQQYRSVAFSMGQTSAEQGFDEKYGGYMYEGPPSDPARKQDGVVEGWFSPYEASHIFWTQCEALLALWQLFAHTGDEVYLTRLSRTWQWFREHQWDTQLGGDAFWAVDRLDKQPVKSLPALLGDDSEVPGDMKGNAWKASYHTGRLLMFLPAWMNDRKKKE